MRQYLLDFFTQFAYPAEAIDELLYAYDKLNSCKEAASIFDQQIASYETTNHLDREETLLKACEAACLANVPEDHATFLIYCCFSQHLKHLYQVNSFSLDVWYDTMCDLRIKAHECKTVKGHWGSFVSGWFTEFFNLNRFALGRLQFEIVKFIGTYGEYNAHGVQLKDENDVIINVHIPSGSRLPYSEVLDSYKKAHQWFRTLHKNGKTVFGCWSWLMYDKLPSITGEGTNTYQFIMDYETVMSKEDPEFIDCWRLFDVAYSGDSKKLPRNGGLRRRYAEYLEHGGVAGIGYGVAVFDGEKILSRKQLP